MYRAFKKAMNDVIMSRRAINNMNNLYPDVNAEELAATDNVCIICREEMTGGKYAAFSFVWFQVFLLAVQQVLKQSYFQINSIMN